MKLTRFRRLRNAATNLDMHFVGERILEVRSLLGGQGLEFNKNNIAITEEGIYYIHPESGMTTKVALYMSNQRVDFHELPVRPVDADGYHEEEMLDEFNKYHLLRCNMLSQIERLGWQGEFKIVQKAEDKFSHRIYCIIDNEEVYQQIENQTLKVCPNCLTKINSLLGVGSEFTQETFSLKHFFDAGFQATWINRGKYSKDRGVFADIYPKDWNRIARRRAKQASYICEQCNTDLSAPERRRFLHVQHTDHLSNKISYTRLRCLCVYCRSDQPDGEKYKKRETYAEYLRILRKEAPSGVFAIQDIEEDLALAEESAKGRGTGTLKEFFIPEGE